MRKRLTSEIAEMQAAAVAKEGQIAAMESQMLRIKDNVQGMVERFREANHTFPLMVAKHMHYEPETQFNEQNVTLYLAELEEYSSMLITYLAYKNELPDAAVSALALDQMVEKDKEAGPLHVSFRKIYIIPADRGAEQQRRERGGRRGDRGRDNHERPRSLQAIREPGLQGPHQHRRPQGPNGQGSCQQPQKSERLITLP